MRPRLLIGLTGFLRFGYRLRRRVESLRSSWSSLKRAIARNCTEHGSSIAGH